MKKSRTKRWLTVLLLSVMIGATGCQSIGGVDLNQVIINQMTVDSMEGTMDITLNLLPDELSEIDPDSANMIKAINGTKIVLDSLKQQSWNEFSLSGRLVIARGEIPFKASMNRSEIVLRMDGASMPVVFPLNADPLSDLTGMGGSGSLDDITGPFQDKAVLKSLFSLIVKHLANPKNISAATVTETVNGQSLSLYKIHSEIEGPEMLDLIKKFLRGLIMDDIGMKQLIGQIYDFEANQTDSSEDSSISDMFFGMGMGFGSSTANDRELEIEFMHTFVKQVIIFMLAAMEDEDASAEFDPIFNKNTYAKSDLFIDSYLNIRKATFEVAVKPEVADLNEFGGISAIIVTGQGQFWNHNKPVTADVPDVGDSDVLFLDDITKPEDDFIRMLDQNSILYQWMKEDLHATRKTAVFHTDDEEYNMDYEAAIIKEGIMAVPARYFSEELGLQLNWNGVTREVTITNDMDGTTTAFKVDSNEAWVNGKEAEMNLSAFIHNGQTYIPLRFVADAFGADIEWDAETRSATVTIE